LNGQYPQIPDISKESAYLTLYAVGNIEYHDLPAIIAKSPYLRRLQQVKYFGDLAHVLETTYEQHITGTSELMKHYPIAFHNVHLTVYQKFLNNYYQNGQSKDTINDLLLHLGRSYHERLATTSSLSSLIGMLAAPPLRRPFGSYIKRTYMKTLTQELINGNTKLADMLRNLRESVVDLYENFLSRLCDDEGRECVAKLIQPLHDILESISPDTAKLVTKVYIDSSVDILREFYRERITPFPDGNDKKNCTINGIGEFRKCIIPSLFILRYRFLGTMLAMGYSAIRLLQATVNTMHECIETGRIIVGITDRLVDIIDTIISLLEAVFINHSSTLLGVNEVKKLKKCRVENGKCVNTEEEFVLTPLGIDNVIHFYRTYLAPTQLPEEFLKFPLGLNPGPNKPEEGVKYQICDLDNKEENCRNIEGTIIVDMPFESYYHDDRIPCCILTVKPLKNYTRFTNRLDNTTLKELAIHIFKEIIPSGYTNINKITEILDTYNKSPLHGIFKDFLDNMKMKRDRQNNGMTILQDNINLFLSHFQVNMIQSDMIPSAYQLDLLHRLDKDINVGAKVDYEKLNDVVLNLSSYSYQVYTLLSSVYTTLFSDLSVLSERINLIQNARQPLNGNDGITKLSKYTVDYYESLIHEYNMLGSKIHETKEILNKKLNEFNALFKESETKKIRIYAEIISKFAENVEKILVNLSRILGFLTNRYLNEPNEVNDPGEHGRRPEIKFDSLVDHAVMTRYRLYKHMRDQDIIVYGLANVYDIMILNENARKLLPNMFGGLSWIAFLVIQSTYGSSLEYMIKELFADECQKQYGKEVGVKPLQVYVQVPVQGVFKPYFHLPYMFPHLPLLSSTITVNVEGCKNNNTNISKKVLCRYKNKTTGIEDIFREYHKKPIYKLKELIKGEDALNHYILVPDPALWHKLIKNLNDEKELSRSSTVFHRKTGILNHHTDIIYAAVIRINDESDTQMLTPDALHDCLLKSISKAIFKFL